MSKEQDHFLISPKGVSCSEVTASSLVSMPQHQCEPLLNTHLTMEGQLISTVEPTALFLERLTLSLGREDKWPRGCLERDVARMQATNTVGGRTEWAWGPK